MGARVEQGRRRQVESNLDFVASGFAATAAWIRADRHRAGVLAAMLLVPAVPLVLAVSVRLPGSDATAYSPRELTPPSAASTSALGPAASAPRSPERTLVVTGVSAQTAADGATEARASVSRAGNPSLAARAITEGSLTATSAAQPAAARPQGRIRPAPTRVDRVAPIPRKGPAPTTPQPETTATAAPAAIPQASPSPPAEPAQAAADTPAAPQPASPPVADGEDDTDEGHGDERDDENGDVAEKRDRKDKRDKRDKNDKTDKRDNRDRGDEHDEGRNEDDHDDDD